MKTTGAKIANKKIKIGQYDKTALPDVIYRLILKVLGVVIENPYIRQFEIFVKKINYHPNVILPRRYHEKMLWRKIFDRNPRFITFCDKLATKDYIREKAGQIRMPRTLWVGDSAQKIPTGLLNNKVVIKCNHGCNFNFFWEPGITSLEEVDRISQIWIAETYGEWNMEWGYFGVPKKIFVEEFVEVSGELADINVRCADGRAILVSVILSNKSERMAFGYFNPDGTRSEFDCIANHSFYNSGILPMDYVVPASFHDAVRCAEMLSLGVDYARYDFMTNGSDLFAGEITVYPAAGVSPATPPGEIGSDTLVEEEWDLRGSWFLSTPQKGWRRVYAKLLKIAI